VGTKPGQIPIADGKENKTLKMQRKKKKPQTRTLGWLNVGNATLNVGNPKRGKKKRGRVRELLPIP